MTAMNKQEYRKMLRNRRCTKQERDVQSDAICRHILNADIFRRSKTIAAYCALPHEADITRVISAALELGKRVALPLCGPAPEMTFRCISSLNELQIGRYGIPAPPEHALLCDAAELDLILVPLEAIDHYGFRLGKGGGYYDCLLSKTGAYAMGCALPYQMVDELPHDVWDKPLHACISTEGIREYCRLEP